MLINHSEDIKEHTIALLKEEITATMATDDEPSATEDNETSNSAAAKLNRAILLFGILLVLSDR